MSTLISFYSNLYRTEFIFDTKVEDYETILISILSEILEINDNIEDIEDNEEKEEENEEKEEHKEKLSKRELKLFSKLCAMDKKILNIRILEKTNLIKFSYIYKNNQVDFDLNNYGKLIHDSVISESLLDFISNMPVLPTIGDIETERNIIQIDLEFQTINYNFKLTKESEDFVENFKETIPSFLVSYCELP